MERQKEDDRVPSSNPILVRSERNVSHRVGAVGIFGCVPLRRNKQKRAPRKSRGSLNLPLPCVPSPIHPDINLSLVHHVSSGQLENAKRSGSVCNFDNEVDPKRIKVTSLPSRPRYRESCSVPATSVTEKCTNEATFPDYDGMLSHLCGSGTLSVEPMSRTAISDKRVTLSEALAFCSHAR